MTSQTLTPEEITAILAGKRDRGGAERYVTRFANREDGSMYWVVNNDSQYKGKTVEQLKGAVKQGLGNAIKKLDGDHNYKLVLVESDLLLIDADMVAAAQAAA